MEAAGRPSATPWPWSRLCPAWGCGHSRGAGTWAQLAVLREALQAVLQQHRDDPVQVGHLAAVGARTSWQVSFQNSDSLESLCSGYKMHLCQSVTLSRGLLSPTPDSGCLCHAPAPAPLHIALSPLLWACHHPYLSPGDQ